MSIFKIGMIENGTIHISMMKNWVSHILFLRKKGAYRLPGSAEKGGYSGRPSVLCHTYKYLLPPTHTHTHAHPDHNIGETGAK